MKRVIRPFYNSHFLHHGYSRICRRCFSFNNLLLSETKIVEEMESRFTIKTIHDLPMQPIVPKPVVYTPLDKIRTNFINSQTYDPFLNYYVLIISGAFCPPHILHLHCLEVVKSFIEGVPLELLQHGDKQTHLRSHSKVVGGYFSPAHDDYCWFKYYYKGYIPAIERIKMLQEMIEQSSWLDVDSYECGSPSFLNFTKVTNRLNSYLKQHISPSIKVVFVCGADVLMKVSFEGFDDDIHIAVLPREQYSTKDIEKKITNYHDRFNMSNVLYLDTERMSEMANRLYGHDKDIFHLVNHQLQNTKQHVRNINEPILKRLGHACSGKDLQQCTLSSTMIRDLLFKKEYDKLNNYLHPGVLEFLKSYWPSQVQYFNELKEVHRHLETNFFPSSTFLSHHPHNTNPRGLVF
ncbi:hypothetical protein ABK040_015800 [Willaertia magna]